MPLRHGVMEDGTADLLVSVLGPRQGLYPVAAQRREASLGLVPQEKPNGALGSKVPFRMVSLR